MLLLLPRSVREARQCLAEGAVPVGGATLVWASWQRDGFPERAVSLRHVPEANVIGPEVLGAAVILHHIDDRVPEVLRRAAAGVGTGAVRRTATVGGNVIGSSLRCLLPAALVLDARATVLTTDGTDGTDGSGGSDGSGGTYETDLDEAVAKRSVLLGLRWRAPVASGYVKLPAEAGGPPPFVVAVAVHRDGGGGEEGDGGRLLRVAVRDGYEVIGASVPWHADGNAGRDMNREAGRDTQVEEVLDAVRRTAVGQVPGTAWDAVRRQVTDVLVRAAGR